MARPGTHFRRTIFAACPSSMRIKRQTKNDHASLPNLNLYKCDQIALHICCLGEGIVQKEHCTICVLWNYAAGNNQDEYFWLETFKMSIFGLSCYRHSMKILILIVSSHEVHFLVRVLTGVDTKKVPRSYVTMRACEHVRGSYVSDRRPPSPTTTTTQQETLKNWSCLSKMSAWRRHPEKKLPTYKICTY